jgi:hypothetical protein
VGEAITEDPDARKWDVSCAWRGLGSQDLDGPARGVDENAGVDVGGMWGASRTRLARCTQRAYFTRVWTVSEAY